MPVGLGARMSNADTTYTAANMVNDQGNLRQPGGAVVQPFYGTAGGGPDNIHTWVWGLTIASAVIVIGAHVLLRSGRRVLG
jgi:hypothetical protein